jgi:ribulose bisphosphate carboxylase small subunit
MHADIKGALLNINQSYKLFEHNGKSMTKKQVKKILEYGVEKGYKTTLEFTDVEIENLLKEK